MIKTFKNLAISFAVIMACSTAVMADGNAFTPLNFDDVSYTPKSSKQTVASSTTSTQSRAVSTTPTAASS